MHKGSIVIISITTIMRSANSHMTAPIALPSVIALGTRKSQQDFQIKFQGAQRGEIQQNNPVFLA